MEPMKDLEKALRRGGRTDVSSATGAAAGRLAKRAAHEQQPDCEAEVRGERDEREAEIGRQMREHHRVDEPDPIGDPGGGKIGERRKQASPKEDSAGGGEREAKALEQPKRQK